jgi:cell division transport system permease protein
VSTPPEATPTTRAEPTPPATAQSSGPQAAASKTAPKTPRSPRPGGRVLETVRGGLAPAARITANLAELVLRDALRNWVRNFRSVTPAIGSMSLLLLIAGMAGLVALAANNILDEQTRQASFVHLYLRQDAPANDVDALRAELLSDHRIAGVAYISSAEAERQARQRPGLSGLIDASGSNPFPANLEVHVRYLADVSGVVSSVRKHPALDQANPSSYDPATYHQLQTGLRDAGFVVIGFLALLGLVSAVVTANAIRAAILARWDDLTIMRLVGASRWMVRGPFVFEGALTGAVAGLVAGVVLVGLFAGSQRISFQAFVSLLPGVGWYAALACAAALLVAGAFLGSASSLFSVRRLRA